MQRPLVVRIGITLPGSLPKFSIDTYFLDCLMSPPRFLVDSLATDALIELGAEESVHAARVLRLGVGSRVELFDGRGNGAAAEIVSQARRQVSVRVCGPLRSDQPPDIAVGLCVSLPRGERQQQLVEIASQLSVHALLPVVTERSVHQPSDKGQSRLHRWAIESAKQCGRNDLLTIGEPIEWSRMLTGGGSQVELPSAGGDRLPFALPPHVRGWIAHPGRVDTPALLSIPAGNVRLGARRSDRQAVDGVRLESPLSGPRGAVWLAIGPEGGFSESEFDQALKAGWQPLSLGPQILRVETAVAVAVTVVRQQLEPAYFVRPPQSVCDV